MPSKKTDKSNLGFLGEEYQLALLKCLIEDPVFFAGIEQLIDPNMFTDNINSVIVGFMKDCYTKTSAPPSYRDLDVYCRGKITNAIDVECATARLKELNAMPVGMNISVVHENAELFFRQQNLVSALKKASDIVKDGDFKRYPELKNLFQKALEVDSNDEIFTRFKVFDNFDAVISPNDVPVIPTGACLIDAAIGGGLEKGTLGLLIAPTSVGKTSATTGFAAGAAVHKCAANNFKGWKVMHLFFEDKVDAIKLKYYGWISKVNFNVRTVRGVQDIVRKCIEDSGYRQLINDNIHCVMGLNGQVDVDYIEREIKRQLALGVKTDLLVIDYFECLKLEGMSSSRQMHEMEGRAIRQIEALGKKYNIAIWCATQGNRGSIDKSTVGMADQGGSITKPQAATTVISLARTEEQRETHRVNILFNKTRSFGTEITRIDDVSFNNGTCTFDFSDKTDLLNKFGIKLDDNVVSGYTSNIHPNYGESPMNGFSINEPIIPNSNFDLGGGEDVPY